MSVKVIRISKLPWTVGAKELAAYCSTHGPIRRVKLPINYETGFPLGYATVQFANEEARALFLDKKHFLEGQQVRVEGGV